MRRTTRGNGICDDHEVEPSVDISSLVDVAFLLLIFFLVTSTLLPKEADLGMALVTDQLDGPRPKLPPLLVGITEAGEVSIDGEAVEGAESGSALPVLVDLLERHVKVAGAVDSEPVVIFQAADGAGHQRLVDVLNAVSGAGIRTVTFDSGWMAGGGS